VTGEPPQLPRFLVRRGAVRDWMVWDRQTKGPGRFFWWIAPHTIGARIAMGSGFWAQIVSMPQSLPYGGDRILDAQHISAFSGEDVNRPVRVKRSVDLVRYLDIGHVLASGEAADFLECDTLQLVSSNERFGHRAGPLNQSILRIVASILCTQTLPL
jgi:hypothetical protein